MESHFIMCCSGVPLAYNFGQCACVNAHEDKECMYLTLVEDRCLMDERTKEWIHKRIKE